jgi:hypothetical protein
VGTAVLHDWAVGLFATCLSRAFAVAYCKYCNLLPSISAFYTSWRGQIMAFASSTSIKAGNGWYRWYEECIKLSSNSCESVIKKKGETRFQKNPNNFDLILQLKRNVHKRTPLPFTIRWSLRFLVRTTPKKCHLQHF